MGALQPKASCQLASSFKKLVASAKFLVTTVVSQSQFQALQYYNVPPHFCGPNCKSPLVTKFSWPSGGHEVSLCLEGPALLVLLKASFKTGMHHY